MRNQEHVRDNARRDIIERRLERFFFWFQVLTAAGQLVLTIAALAVLLTTAEKPSVLAVYFVLHGCAMALHVAQLFYHRRRPVAASPAPFSLPGAMALCRAAAEVLWTLAYFYGLFFVLPIAGFSFAVVTARLLICWTTLVMLAPFFFLLVLLCCLPLVISLLPFVIGAPERTRTPGDVIDAQPVATYDPMAATQTLSNGDSLAIEAESAACPICIEDYSAGAQLRVLPCKHHFHSDCVDQWLRVASTCPLCVQPLVDSDV